MAIYFRRSHEPHLAFLQISSLFLVCVCCCCCCLVCSFVQRNCVAEMSSDRDLHRNCSTKKLLAIHMQMLRIVVICHWLTLIRCDGTTFDIARPISIAKVASQIFPKVNQKKFEQSENVCPHILIVLVRLSADFYECMSIKYVTEAVGWDRERIRGEKKHRQILCSIRLVQMSRKST